MVERPSTARLVCRVCSIATVGVAFVLSLLLAGCAGSQLGSSPTPEPSVTLVPSSLYPGAYKLPTEQIDARDPAMEQAIQTRKEQLITQCMAERGFTYTPTAPSPSAGQPNQIYGIVDKEWASTYAYLSPPAVDEMKNPPPRDDPNAAPPDMNAPMSAYDQALVGAKPDAAIKSSVTGKVVGHYAPDSCYWKAETAVSSELGRESELNSQLSTITRETGQAVVQEHAYKAAQSKWIKCMADKGYKVSSPGSVGFTDPPTVTAELVTEALQDIDCKNSTGFLKTWSKLLVEAQTKALAKYPGLIQELSSLYDADYQLAVGGGK